jgi:CTP:molybdopterin cytidylyltransferase MocA
VNRTVALVLAVDPGVGFHGSKYLEKVGRKRLIEVVVDEARTWPVDDVVVVLGADGEQIAAQADLGDALLVLDLDSSQGLAASLRIGLDTLARDRHVERAVFAYGDQPGVEPDVVAALVATQAEPGCLAAVPRYRYARGWPIVIGRDLWVRFLGLEGDIDVLDVLGSHPEGVKEVWFDRLTDPRIRDADDLPHRPRR